MVEKLKYIEHRRTLYMGFGRPYPIIVWRRTASQWRLYRGATPRPDEWGEFVSRAEAERLYPRSTTAPLPAGIETEREMSFDELVKMLPELFDGYNGRITRWSPVETAWYLDAVLPDHLKASIAARRRR